MDHFWPLRRYFSLMCIQHTTLEMPYSEPKMTTPLRLDFM